MESIASRGYAIRSRVCSCCCDIEAAEQAFAGHADRGAKIAPRNTLYVAMLYDWEKQRGYANRTTPGVAQKLVAYLGCRGSSAKRILFPPAIWDRRILGQVAGKTRLPTAVQWGIGSFRWLVRIVSQIGQFLSIVSKIEQLCA
jgi:hypothetical protein